MKDLRLWYSFLIWSLWFERNEEAGAYVLRGMKSPSYMTKFLVSQIISRSSIDSSFEILFA